MLTVRDKFGKVVLDVADTPGRDLIATMAAEAGVEYEIRLHDLDFAGDRSYVYRLDVTAAPRVAAVYPAAGRRGQTQSVEFYGVGLATGAALWESITRDVTFPDSPAPHFETAIETPWGSAPVQLGLSSIPESIKSTAGDLTIPVPGAVTGAFGERFGSDTYSMRLPPGAWVIEATAPASGSSAGAQLDLELQLLGPDGKPIALNDDVPGSTNARLTHTVSAEGEYRVIVADRSGRSGTRAGNYRIEVTPVKDDIELTLPTQLNLPLGGQAKLTVKVIRSGNLNEAIPLRMEGLPAGVTVPENLAIPAGKAELAIELTCAADAGTTASLCTVVAAPTVNGQPTERRSDPILVAITMKPRFKLTPEGLDDVRKVHRGSTYLFPLLVERFEGFTGPIVLEMTAKQQRHRQGLASDEYLIPPTESRVEYPIFVPEWMETTKTSRMILNGRAEVADPKGTVRTLLQKQELRFGILPQGALLKLTQGLNEPSVKPGDRLTIPVQLSVAPDLQDPIEISIVPADGGRHPFRAEPLTLVPGQKEAHFTVEVATSSSPGEYTLMLRARSLKDGQWPVISETPLLIEIRGQ